MDNRLLIRVLKLLEETYPQFYHADKLRKKSKMPSLDGEFFKVIKYLKDSGKIIVVLPESRLASTQRERLITTDEISINKEGIDFLMRIKLIEVNERRNKIITLATIIIALATIMNIIVALFLR